MYQYLNAKTRQQSYKLSLIYFFTYMAILLKSVAVRQFLCINIDPLGQQRNHGLTHEDFEFVVIFLSYSKKIHLSNILIFSSVSIKNDLLSQIQEKTSLRHIFSSKRQLNLGSLPTIVVVDVNNPAFGAGNSTFN